MSTIMGEHCPSCRSALTSVAEATPWCGECEWNLDDYPPNKRYSWFWRRIVRADRRAGFRSDHRLAQTTEAAGAGTRGYRFLVALSAVLLLLVVAAAVVGVWLVVAGGSLWPVVLGLVLLGCAALLRPRFGRLKPLLADAYRVEPTSAPEVHRLIDRIATELDAPRPDVVLFDFAWNAGVTTVGLRRTRVLVLGIPLLLALRPRQVVALLGHELGHLKYEDSRRSLLIQPARTVFGRLSRLVRPLPLRAASRTTAFGQALLLLWQLVAGTVSLLLWLAHVGVNILAAGGDRPIELRADAMAARVAGTTATLETLDTLAILPSLTTYLQRHVPAGEAADRWRRFLRTVQDREAVRAQAWRQLSIRTAASLFATHPAPGRRYQWLAGRPSQAGTVLLDEAEAARIEQEVARYAEAMHRMMLAEATD